jgi:hypothetical protein
MNQILQKSPGLQLGSDGSLENYIQNTNPGPGKASNWLPAPAGSLLCGPALWSKIRRAGGQMAAAKFGGGEVRNFKQVVGWMGDLIAPLAW